LGNAGRWHHVFLKFTCRSDCVWNWIHIFVDPDPRTLKVEYEGKITHIYHCRFHAFQRLWTLDQFDLVPFTPLGIWSTDYMDNGLSEQYLSIGLLMDDCFECVDAWSLWPNSVMWRFCEGWHCAMRLNWGGRHLISRNRF
jgi:hypothetical protein